MPDLPKYGSVEKCLKCGYGWPSPSMVVVHQDEDGQWGSHSILEWAESELEPCSRSRKRGEGKKLVPRYPEHIKRTCKRCDYSWDEAPLDEEKI